MYARVCVFSTLGEKREKKGENGSRTRTLSRVHFRFPSPYISIPVRILFRPLGRPVPSILVPFARLCLRLDDLSTLQENFILQTCLARQLGGIEVEVGRERAEKLRITQNNVPLINLKLVYSSFRGNWGLPILLDPIACMLVPQCFHWCIYC